jgi:N-acetylmuramic acid 6-phosphate (MurNAc-6-P) etherase
MSLASDRPVTEQRNERSARLDELTTRELVKLMNDEDALVAPAVGRELDAIARAIDRPIAEVYPYFNARVLVWLNAVAPGICDRIVKRFGRQPLRRTQALADR